jgi:predicted phosphodiesterase
MRLIFLSDLHFGEDEDQRAYKFALSLLPKLNIDAVFLGGDIFDHTAVSRYRKSLEIEGLLQEELDHGFKQLSMLRNKLPLAKFHFLPGNHEKRLADYLGNKARALTKLRVLTYKSMYRLDELDITFHPEGQPVKMGHLYLAHGHEFTTTGQNPARVALNSVNSNILFGHIHRQSVANKTELSGRALVAYSNPCLSSLTPDYMLKPDWVQGFSTVDFTKSGYFDINQHTFWRDNDRISTMINGKLYQERKTNGDKR